jgi:hypothetical protein
LATIKGTLDVFNSWRIPGEGLFTAPFRHHSHLRTRDAHSSRGFHPTPQEFAAVVQILNSVGSLPFELVFEILDHAEYWCIWYFEDLSEHDISEETVECLRTGNVPLPFHALRRLRLYTVAHDQGWSDTAHEFRGTTQNSWTWGSFQFKSKSGQVLVDQEFYRNLHADANWQPHEFILDLKNHPALVNFHNVDDKSGIQVSVFNSAQFPGWVNHVQSNAIELFFSPVDVPIDWDNFVEPIDFQEQSFIEEATPEGT